MEHPQRICRNCSAVLHGEYCSQCGQKDKDLHIPVKELASEFIQVLPSFDRRLWNSLKPLIIAPGFLTLEYLAGKRKQYISPFKLYFTISFLFFLVSSMADDSAKRELSRSAAAGKDTDSTDIVLRGDTNFVSVTAPNSKLHFNVKDSSEVSDLFGPRMVTALRNMKANPDLMFDKIKEHRPKMIFLLMPVFALLLKLLYFRTRSLYIKHLVFSFYFHSFLFLLLLLVDTAELVHLPYTGVLSAGAYLSLPVYLYYGLKRVYGQTRWKTLIKLLMLLFTYGVAFLFAISAAALIIIYLFYL